MPAIPTRVPPPGDRSQQDLWNRVQEALRAVPLYFSSKTYIEGLEAGDLFNLNAVLGSTIEIRESVRRWPDAVLDLYPSGR